MQLPARANNALTSARDTTLTFGRFAWHDVNDTLRAFVRTAARALVVCASLVFIAAVASNPGALRQSPAITLAVWIGVSLYYGFFPAVFVGVCGAGWRLFGATLVVPLVTFPLATVATFYLGAPLLTSRAHALADAFVQAAIRYGLPTVTAVGRLAHAGAIAIPFILAAALFDAVHLLRDGRVAMALLWLALSLATLTAVAAVLTTVLTLPPMAWAFLRRARLRWNTWRTLNAPSTTAAQSPPSTPAG